MSQITVDKTAIGMAFIRGLESAHPENMRLFEDSYAMKLLPGAVYKIFSVLLAFKFVRTLLVKAYEKNMSGMYGGMICRTRYFDESVTQAINDGFTTIVILGAGLDSRAYRIPGIQSTTVFELDRPSMIEHKKACIKGISGSLPSYVRYVPINFNEQSIEDVLAANGLDLSQPALFLWEGVTQYISEDAVRSTLHYISTACQGSRVVFTYVIKSVLDGTSKIEGVEKLLQQVSNADAPWMFGIDPANIAAFLTDNKLSLLEDVGASDYEERYLKPHGRNLTGFTIERFVCAEV